MKKPRLNAESQALLRQLIELYQPKSVSDIQEMLKALFAGTMEDMLKAELDTELGYKKNSQESKTTDNRRNGSYPKTVTSSMGEIELNIPRDRKGEYEPELIPKGSHDVSELERRCCLYMPRAQATGIYPMWSMISTALSSVMRRYPISWIAFNRESLSGRIGSLKKYIRLSIWTL